MINKLKPKSEFTRNVLTLMTGTTIAQAIPIVISPILTRIYSPEDFGLFALYMSIVSILTVIVAGRYELAIMVPKNNRRAFSVLVLAILFTVIFSIIILIIICIFKFQIINLFHQSEISIWIYFIPLSIMLNGIYQSLYYYFLRNKLFSTLAKGKVYQSFMASSVNLLLFFMKNETGLVAGSILGQLSSIYIFLSTGGSSLVKKVSFKQIQYMFILYIDFLKYNSLSALLNYSSIEFAILFISSFFQPETVGIYFLTQKILFAPSGIIGSAIGQVFIQKVFDKNRNFDINKLFHSTIIKLLYIIILPSIVIYIYGEDIFLYIFGKDWSQAGLYAKIMLPYFILRFIGAPVSTLPSLMGYQKNMLYWNMFRLLGVMLIGYFNTDNFTNFIFLYSFFMGFTFIILLFFVNIITKNKKDL